MNKWRITLIFLAGFWLHEVLAHVWLTIDGLLPINSMLWPWPITDETNKVFIVLNLAIFLVLAYFAFARPGEKRPSGTVSTAVK